MAYLYALNILLKINPPPQILILSLSFNSEFNLIDATPICSKELETSPIYFNFFSAFFDNLVYLVWLFPEDELVKKLPVFSSFSLDFPALLTIFKVSHSEDVNFIKKGF